MHFEYLILFQMFMDWNFFSSMMINAHGSLFLQQYQRKIELELNHLTKAKF